MLQETQPCQPSSVEDSETYSVNSSTTSTTHFLLNNKRLLLTYSGSCDKVILANKLLSLAPCQYLKIATEKGMSTGAPYDHTHAAVEFVNPFRTTNPRAFDFKEPTEQAITSLLHPNIRRITTFTHWHRVQEYLSKDDPSPYIWSRDGPDDDAVTVSSMAASEAGRTKKGVAGKRQKPTTWLDELLEVPTLADALRLGPISAALATCQVFDRLHEKPVSPPSEPLRSWQADIVKEAENSHDPRLINWIWDPVGGEGKSFLGRWLVGHYPHDWTMFKSLGATRDMSTIWKGLVDRGYEGRFTYVDLPRAAQIKDFYPSLEDMSDGCCTATKYAGKTIHFKPQSIWVAANFLPDLEKMSKDRWRVRALDKGSLRTLTLSEVLRYLA